MWPLTSLAEFGLACHLGVLSGLPCVGVAKNLLQVQGVFKSEEHQAQVINLQRWLTFNAFLTWWDDASAAHAWKSRSRVLFHNTAPQGGAANWLYMFQIQVSACFFLFVCCLLKYTFKMSWANQRTESSISFQCVYVTRAHFCMVLVCSVFWQDDFNFLLASLMLMWLFK